MPYKPEAVERLVAAIFARAGCRDEEARTVARHLVEANLVGHDSHGVIRVPSYIDWLRKDMVRANQSARIVFETDTVAVIDGQFGFGQVIGEQAMAAGIRKARRHALAAVALRNSGHLGRIGDWAIMAADAGLVSLHWVNTSGAGILVAPFGGTDRRLSANPIAAGAPRRNAPPLILDIATSAIAEGKIQVARNKGEALPEGMVIDGAGRPTRDPQAFYAEPPGAIFPFGGHKGYALSVLCEVLAGALTGGGTSHPSNPTARRVVNGMFSVLLDPTVFTPAQEFAREIRRLAEWVRASPPLEAGGAVLRPGDLERRIAAERRRDGIPLDAATLDGLVATARGAGVGEAIIAALEGGVAEDAA